MRTIERSSVFRRDYKHVKTMPRHKDLDTPLVDIITCLVDDKPLAAKYRDHALSGNWNGHRECHIKPDLLLIYKKPDTKSLWLVRIGSHSELFS
jgi:mRNA interferase YafQ